MPNHRGARFVPHLLLLAMIAIWGGSYAVVKAALDSLSPFALVTLRFWIAVLCLVPFLGRNFAKDLARSRRHGLMAGLVLALGYLLQTTGMNETSASTGGFLAGIIVLLVAVGGASIFRTRFGWRAFVGLLLGLVGIVLVCQGDAGGGARDTPRGIALQIGACVSYSAHILLVSRHGREQPTIAYCMWQLLFVALTATAAAGLDGRFAASEQTPLVWTPALLGLVAYLGFLATALGIAVQSRVQHRIPPMPLALLFALQPLFAALIAWATLDDRMGALQLAGGGTIVLGVLLTSLDRTQ